MSLYTMTADALTPTLPRALTMRPSEANVWARRPEAGGCLSQVTLPPARVSQDTDATRRGTQLHAIVADLLCTHAHQRRAAGAMAKLPQADRDACETAAAAARDLIQETFGWYWESPPRTIETEAEVAFGDFAKVSGTPDLVVAYWPVPDTPEFVTAASPDYDKGRQRLLVVDYKFGQRPVDVAGNMQLRLYAMMAAFAVDSRVPGPDDEITLAIIQPARDPVVSRQTILRHELDRDHARLRNALLWIRDADASAVDRMFAPSEENCRWCRGAVDGTCDAYKTWHAGQAAAHYATINAQED